MVTLTKDLIARARRLPPSLRHRIALILGGAVRPPGEEWPAITTEAIDSDPYHGYWGGYQQPQAAYGVEFAASGQGPGKQDGPILIDSYGQGQKIGRTLDNCRVVGIDTTGGCSLKFGRRTYMQIEPVVRKSEFLGAFIEHCDYESILQGGLFEDVRFGKIGAKNAGGAAFQQALRNMDKTDQGGPDYTHETQNPELSQVEATRIFRRCEFNHIGVFGSQRWGAFTISEHFAELIIRGVFTNFINTHVRLEQCRFQGGHINAQDGNGKPVKSARGLLVQGRPSLVLYQTEILYPDPLSDWTAKVEEVPHVEIVGGVYEDGLMQFTNPKSVSIRGAKGAAVVRILDRGGVLVYSGSIAKDYHYQAA